MMPGRAIFFDVDGTLVPETSSSQHLAGFLGHYDELVAAENAYAAGKLDNFAVSVLDAAGWQSHHKDDIDRWIAQLPLVDGIPEVVAWCRDRDIQPYLATLAWQPVGEYLCDRFGFEGSCGPRLSSSRGVFSGGVESHLDEFGKRDLAFEVVRSLGLEPVDCIAVGDSRSDLPLFACVGFAVAFNAGDAAQAAANVSIDSNDLRDILPALATWLEAN